MKLKGLLSAALAVALAALPAFGRAARVAPAQPVIQAAAVSNAAPKAVTWKIAQDGSYTSKGDVAAYLKTYGKLPKNFITKSEARRLGWTGGPLEPYAPGKSIGGDHFGNYERKLPQGRYRECDIDTKGRPRGAKRIIYSDDRRLYYTADHYNTFERIP